MKRALGALIAVIAENFDRYQHDPGSESRMPPDATGEHATAPPVRPTSPVISAASGQALITGTGFLPNRAVTVRIRGTSEDIVDYLTYISDADGCLSAPLPETAITETTHIDVTDHRLDPAGSGGLLWSNTVNVAVGGP